jgi:hypothetical protein
LSGTSRACPRYTGTLRESRTHQKARRRAAEPTRQRHIEF